MCDTMVALGNATSDGSVLFAKNSDREPNEAYQLQIIPAADWKPGEMVKMTYVEIPQASHTHTVFLVRPFWMWGAEMGANEHSVVIGNEAVFTRVPYGKEPGILGMDFLRLALERSACAEEALGVITGLLERYGQSGNCGMTSPFYYHNSFLICDKMEAWVLETAGKHWAAEKVRDVRSISNAITIQSNWDLCSPDLERFARDRGWCRQNEVFSFHKAYADPLFTFFADAIHRQTCSTNAMKTKYGRLMPADMMGILRTHRGDPGDGWSPDAPLLGSDICMHAGFGPARGSQTTGSLVSHLRADGDTHWVTGTAAPCLSVFKPVWMDAGLPDLNPAPTGVFSPDALFWQGEQLHRQVLRDYASRAMKLVDERCEIETEFLNRESELRSAPLNERFEFTRSCFERSGMALDRWIEKIDHRKPEKKNAFYYETTWKKFSADARIPEMDN